MKGIEDMQICISGDGYRHQMVDGWHWCGSRPHVANVPNKTMSAQEEDNGESQVAG